MSLFTEVPDAHVVLCRRGVFQQTSVYRRENRLFAKVGNGKYVGLRDHKQTTDPKVFWDYIDVDYDVERVSSAIILSGAVTESRSKRHNRKRLAA
jgi:hypothetical protein